MNTDTEPGQGISPFVAADVDFERGHAEALYRAGFMDTHPHRWMRVHEEVRFEDVVALLTGQTQTVISCPFHGRDSTPSFHIYRRGNDAFCFGCPPGEQYYDSIIFAAKKLGLSRLGALRWLEKQFDLPAIADIDPEEYAEEQQGDTVRLTFRDVLPEFVRVAAKEVQRLQDVDLAREYLEILFDGWPARQEEKEDPDAGDPLPMARVLGKTTIDFMLARKRKGH